MDVSLHDPDVVERVQLKIEKSKIYRNLDILDEMSFIRRRSESDYCEVLIIGR
ncbi:hypothetical protein MU1_09550 [Paenibacillus glycanilyticus]|uniref:Uncharacterized protein n=1 Tax=Paenibacillus glycanilyticus TaxID=126569 RepID=A0ABQ6GBB1_9BACL|nr:hypothetical protein MU1_09550 [Paenibacillus glycanilyticus]